MPPYNAVPSRSNAPSLSRTSGPLPKSDSVQLLVSLMNCPPASSPETASSRSITIEGLDADANTHHIPCDPQCDQLSLSGLGLHAVTLDALAASPDNAIREVSLAANALARVDLAPLAACANLTVLTLNSNRLASIDLAPLASCRSLERLWLHDNSLASVDLAPLASCKALRSIYLEDNSIHNASIDLSPLEATPNLRSLRIGGNRLAGTLDLTPLLQCPSLSVFNVDTSVALTADADSTQARVSPALRRIVLDIKFTGNAQATTVRRPKGRTTPPVSPRAYAAPSSPRRRAAQPARTEKPVAAAPSAPTIVKVLLVAFRRLARYATEDALSKCGQVMIRSTDQGTISHDVVMDSHVVLLNAPSGTTLRKVSGLSSSVPTVVLGTGRYRSSVDNELLALLDRFNFYPDPLSPDDAKAIFKIGHDFLTGASDAQPSVRVKDVSNVSPPSIQMANSPSDDDMSDSPTMSSPPRKSFSPPLGSPRASVHIELEDIEDDFEANTTTSAPALSTGQITLTTERSTDVKTCSDVSRILSDRRRRSFGAAANDMDCDIGRQYRNKLRAERASVEAAFQDLGGYATMDSCTYVARACGLPKCAGPTLFRAAFGSSFEIESTTPEAGVPNAPMERKKRISKDSFLIYWDSRIKLYEGEERLSNILEDSHYTRVQTTGENSGYSAYGAPLFRRVNELDCNSTSQHREASFNWQPMARGRVGGGGKYGKTAPFWNVPTDLSCPCDAGVEDLIRTFMEGRSSRFGSYALVKMSEAVAIGSSLVLYAIRGHNKNRVGGRARPVCPKEVRESKLNAALIAAEVGIFEGVASGLSMNEIRSVKGSFVTEASPGVIPRSGGCALNCSLSLEEVQRFCLTRKTLLPGAVALGIQVHCRQKMSMSLSEFAIMVSAMNDASSSGAVDYFFSIGDVDHNDRWTLADMQEFHMEKGRMWEDDGMAVSDLRDFWVNLGDMLGMDIWSNGISRRELHKLGEKDRRTVIQSLLFVDDDYSLLNIRRTMELNRNSSSPSMVMV